MNELLYTLILFAQQHPILALHMVAGVLVVVAWPIAAYIESHDWGDEDDVYELISRYPNRIDTRRIDHAGDRARQRMRARSHTYLHTVHDTLRREL